MSSFTLVAADTLSEADLHAATVAAFADYLAGPFEMTLAQFPSFIARQGVDLARSRVAISDGAIGIIESRVAKAVGKILKERGTARNWATLEKLQAMVDTDA